MNRLTSCCLLAWLAVSSVASAADRTPTSSRNWPQWRGPMANGVAPEGSNPPLEWSEEKNIRWKIQVPGESTATPILWEDQVIIVSAVKTDREGKPEEPVAPPPAKPAEDAKGDDGKDGKSGEGKPKGNSAFRNAFNIKGPTVYYQFVTASYDRKTGKKQWEHVAKEAVPHEGHHPDGSFASASPMTDGKQIYVSFGSRGVYCYDLAGNQKWSRDLGRMKIFNTFGEGSSPVAYGDAVIVNWDHQGGSFIVCLDAATGEIRWKVDREESSTWATPLIVPFDGKVQVIVNGARRVRSYDLKTGEVIWACGGQAPSAIPCPVTDGKRAFVMTGYMGNALFAIPLNSVGDITGMDDKIAWKRNKPGTPYVPSPILYGDLLFFTGGNKGLLSCINAETGEALIDRQRVQGIENIYASPVGASDHIYFTSREGNTVVIKRTGELEILATNKLDDRFDASAAISGNQIFLRGRDNLYCIGAE